ncbi:MAG: hypothetical protein LBH66_07835 [Oscillospiraceae bacterium]|jgi:hypothetical protein|nr:hypothetical protein [Oscillospiraceae bacterium]
MRITWTKLAAIALVAMLSLTAFIPGTLAESAEPRSIELDNGITLTIKSDENGGSSIEYVEASGIRDAETLETLNAYLRWFSSDTYLDDGEDREWDTVEGKTSFSVLGGRYLSVRTEYFFSGARLAHPWSDIHALVFDLEAGEPDTQLTDYLPLDAGLRSAITDGAFELAYPDTEPDDLWTRFAEEYIDEADPEYYHTDFYLTETGIALFLRDRIHAEGDYWVIEAPFDKLDKLVTPMLAELIAPDDQDRT